MEDKQARMFVFSYIMNNLYIYSQPFFLAFKWDRKYKTEPMCPNATFMLVNKSIYVSYTVSIEKRAVFPSFKRTFYRNRYENEFEKKSYIRISILYYDTVNESLLSYLTLRQMLPLRKRWLLNNSLESRLRDTSHLPFSPAESHQSLFPLWAVVNAAIVLWSAPNILFQTNAGVRPRSAPTAGRTAHFWTKLAAYFSSFGSAFQDTSGR